MKVLFLGESGVGKTTFIKLLVTGTFSEMNEKRLKENVLLNAAKFGVKDYASQIELVDGSGRPSKEERASLLENTNVLVLMYDFNLTATFNKLKHELFPQVINLPNLYAVFVVGNKVDLLDSNVRSVVINQHQSEVDKLKEECPVAVKYFYISCKDYVNVSNLFLGILDALIYPVHLFYKGNYANDRENVFNESFEKALIRVFRILDKNKEGIIKKNEFKKIHNEIFSGKLDDEHFSALDEFIKVINRHDSDINIENGVTEDGFILLNKAAVQIKQSQICWSFLRRFGYSDKLVIDETYFVKKGLKKSNSSEWVAQLTKKAISLLKSQFEYFCRTTELSNDKSNNYSYLSSSDWNKIFKPLSSLESLSFHKVFRTSAEKAERPAHIEDWLLFWECLVRIDPIEAFKLFTYTGFDITFQEFALKTDKSIINYTSALPNKVILVGFLTYSDEFKINFRRCLDKFLYLVDGDEYHMLKGKDHNFVLTFPALDNAKRAEELKKTIKKFDMLILGQDLVEKNIFEGTLLNIPFLTFRSDGNDTEQSLLESDISERGVIRKLDECSSKPINYLKPQIRSSLLERRKLKIFKWVSFFVVAGFSIFWLVKKKCV